MKFFIFSVIFFFGPISSMIAYSQDTVHWRSNYKIKWEDFQKKPDNASKYKAISNFSIHYTLSYNQTSFNYKVTCTFNKTRSWSLSSNQNLLSHEQGHFDLSELFARKLRQSFKNYKLNFITIVDDFKKIYANIIEERDKMNALYDKETDLSRNKQKQNFWSKKITAELTRLSSFAE